MNEVTFESLATTIWTGDFNRVCELGEYEFECDPQGFPLRPNGYMDVGYIGISYL
jgi:hypothetical protein